MEGGRFPPRRRARPSPSRPASAAPHGRGRPSSPCRRPRGPPALRGDRDLAARTPHARPRAHAARASPAARSRAPPFLGRAYARRYAASWRGTTYKGVASQCVWTRGTTARRRLAEAWVLPMGRTGSVWRTAVRDGGPLHVGRHTSSSGTTASASHVPTRHATASRSGGGWGRNDIVCGVAGGAVAVLGRVFFSVVDWAMLCR